MISNTQPWIHSWYGDLLGLHSIPFLFSIWALLGLAPFDGNHPQILSQMVFAVLIIDWAHIFAHWWRIYSNPLETSVSRKRFLVSYFMLIPLMTLILQLGTRAYIGTFLIYFVIFHFVKQSFGFIKIYSRVDGVKSPFELMIENGLIYLCMWTPVAYWHIHFPDPGFTWAKLFIKIEALKYFFWPLLVLLVASISLYIPQELKRWKRNGRKNIPKNIALLGAALGWGIVTILPEQKTLIFFTVVLAHDLSYTFMVWFTGRRDAHLTRGSISWVSWWSLPGFFFYLAAIILISHPIMVASLELIMNQNSNYWLIGTLLNELPSGSSWWLSLGFSLYFSTQGHHYFIDRYLWKRDKDLGAQLTQATSRTT